MRKEYNNRTFEGFNYVKILTGNFKHAFLAFQPHETKKSFFVQFMMCGIY